MQHVKGLFHQFRFGIFPADGEPGFVCFAIHFHQVIAVIQGDLILVHIFLQGWHKFLDPEQYSPGITELKLDVLAEQALLEPVVSGKIQGFLWCSRTLDRHGRLREYRRS